jgi:dienelactone hydrolase
MKPERFAGLFAAAGLAAALLGLAGLSRADEVPWLADRTVEVAAHRMSLMHGPSGHALVGYLARPKAPGRRPAVVELHGCGGFGGYDVVAADVLSSFGYAALALDSLGHRNACGAGPYGQVAEAIDAYAARRWLAEQPFVDPKRIAVLGFSMGAQAALDSVESGGPLEQAYGRHFRAAVAFYPNCRFRAGVMSAPTLILIGEKDDWARASWCRHMLARREGKGAPVELIVYPGATHAFNIPARPRQNLGHRLEYDPVATAEAWRAVRRFLRERLGAARNDEARGSPAIR